MSECVDGARKYLKILTDRQTDRQFRMLNSTENFKEQENTKPKYKYEYNKLCGQGKYAPKIKGGGYDNKYRKLRGLGEYDDKNGTLNGDANKGQQEDGEYP